MVISERVMAGLQTLFSKSSIGTPEFDPLFGGEGGPAARGGEESQAGARRGGFVHGGLAVRGIDGREVLLGLRFRRRQQACAVAGRKDDGLSHGHVDEGPLVDLI